MTIKNLRERPFTTTKSLDITLLTLSILTILLDNQVESLIVVIKFNTSARTLLVD